MVVSYEYCRVTASLCWTYYSLQRLMFLFTKRSDFIDRNRPRTEATKSIIRDRLLSDSNLSSYPPPRDCWHRLVPQLCDPS